MNKKLLSIITLSLGICLLTSCANKVSHTQIADLSNAVLKLSVFDENGTCISEGSGFCVYDSETLITNYHVIENGYSVVATSEGEINYNIAGVCYYDKDRDIAILKFENDTNLPVLPMASSFDIGQEVYAIGSPLGLKNTISNGIISGERVNGEYTDIQITTPISPGSSGGVLLNAKGKVVGITYAGIREGQNLNFAIPVTDFNSIEFDIDTVESFSDVINDNLPGNMIENYTIKYGFPEAPFISEFMHNRNLYTVHKFNIDGNIGLIIKSKDLEFEETLIGYTCPNAYKSKLYCYNGNENEIVSIDIDALISNNYKTNKIVNLSDLKLDSCSSIFVNDNKILIRSNDTIVLTDLKGNKISEFCESGLDNAIMTSEKSLSYKSGTSNSITTLNLDSFEKDTIQVNSNFSSIIGYSNGIFYLQNKEMEFLIYDTESYSTQTVDWWIEGVYKDYIVCEIKTGVVNENNGFKLAQTAPYSVNVFTGERYEIPLYNCEYVNFGKHDKMYVCGPKYKSADEWVIYRMNLDGSNLEEVGIYLK